MEARLIEIEIKLSYAEDTLEALNRTCSASRNRSTSCNNW